MQKEIVLTSQTNHVTVRDIPELFATALHSGVNENAPKQVIEIEKMPLTEENTLQWCGEGCQAFPVSLKQDDIKLLWADLPPLVLPMDEAKWEPYRVAYEQFNITDWQLITVMRTPYFHQCILWHATVAEYKNEVKKAVYKGELIPRSPLTVLPVPDAIGEQLQDAFVTIENLKEYAGKLGIGLRISDTYQAETTPANTEVIKGVTKKEIQRVFAKVYFDYAHWGSNLADVPKWLLPCRVSRGSKSKRVSHSWNPVLIGLALMDKGITKRELNLVFMNLKDWSNEWREKTDLMD